MLFEVKVLRGGAANTQEGYREPEIVAWNVTYIDSQTIRTQIEFNNTLFISSNNEEVTYFLML